VKNIPWLLVPALLLEAVFYFLPAWPAFAKRFGKVNRYLQALLIWFSGVVPVWIMYASLGEDPVEFPLLAVSVGIVCLWFLVLPHRPVADLLLLGLVAAFILLPAYQGFFPKLEGGPKLAALGKLLWLRIGISVFLFLRGWNVPGFGVWPDKRDWVTGLQQFLIFFTLLLPVGLYFGVLRFQLPKMDGWLIPFASVGIFVGVYLFIALGEEFFFRGVLQPLLAQGLGSKWIGVLVSSLCFGAVHLPYRNFPNWRFALLATVAGVFYGQAFQKAHSLKAAMITHALVVTVWTVLFARSL
jgi:membrane protease YdiL (CAAX protease family)